MLKLILLSAALIGLAIAGIAIKMFLKKDGRFEKTCGSVDPASGRVVACTCKSEEPDKCHSKTTLHRVDEQIKSNLE